MPPAYRCCNICSDCSGRVPDGELMRNRTGRTLGVITTFRLSGSKVCQTTKNSGLGRVTIASWLSAVHCARLACIEVLA